ncbi:MAG: hypothetical protein WCO26_20790, partial [Deltaproteobacteria bacterium]
RVLLKKRERAFSLCRRKRSVTGGESGQEAPLRTLAMRIFGRIAKRSGAASEAVGKAFQP